MKKLLLLILSVTLSVSALAACGGGGNKTSSTPEASSSIDPKTYTVTFKQGGQTDVVKTVEEGKDLTDIPSPAAKTGYTVVWDRTDFSEISANITVNAVATANEYTVTYDANGGTVTPATQKVTYDAVPGSFAVPTKADYDFVAWTYNGAAVQPTSTWTIANNVTLVASWEEILPEIFTVSFVQDGQTTVTRTVEDGATLTDVPTPVAETGYDVAWDRSDFTNITGNITVNAVRTAKTYTVTYDANGGTVTPATQTVTYDAKPNAFATPTRTGYVFQGWKYDNKTVSANEPWKTAENVTLVADWQAKTYTLTLDTQGGTLATKTVEVTFGQPYDLKTPTKSGYDFQGWTCGSVSIATKGTWSWDLEAQSTLTAGWKKSTEVWTPNY